MKRSEMVYELSIHEYLPVELTRSQISAILKAIEDLGMLPPPITDFESWKNSDSAKAHIWEPEE